HVRSHVRSGGELESLGLAGSQGSQPVGGSAIGDEDVDGRPVHVRNDGARGLPRSLRAPLFFVAPEWPAPPQQQDQGYRYGAPWPKLVHTCRSCVHWTLAAVGAPYHR